MPSPLVAAATSAKASPHIDLGEEAHEVVAAAVRKGGGDAPGPPAVHAVQLMELCGRRRHASSWSAFGYLPRTVSTGQGTAVTTREATLPRKSLANPVRP